MALPLDRFLNLVYFFATENSEEQERDKFDMRLNAPPAGRSRRRIENTKWSKESEESALSGLSAALGLGGAST